MIQRKRGHIVAILAGLLLIPSPRTCSYTATKNGLKGLMSALYYELCADGHERNIQLTEVYPYLLSTNHIIDLVKDKIE
jgi:short-subunit dehydrogenase